LQIERVVRSRFVNETPRLAQLKVCTKKQKAKVNKIPVGFTFAKALWSNWAKSKNNVCF
jgi:hypothetical protein